MANKAIPLHRCGGFTRLPQEYITVSPRYQKIRHLAVLWRSLLPLLVLAVGSYLPTLNLVCIDLEELNRLLLIHFGDIMEYKGEDIVGIVFVHKKIVFEEGL